MIDYLARYFFSVSRLHRRKMICGTSECTGCVKNNSLQRLCWCHEWNIINFWINHYGLSRTFFKPVVKRFGEKCHSIPSPNDCQIILVKSKRKGYLGILSNINCCKWTWQIFSLAWDGLHKKTWSFDFEARDPCLQSPMNMVLVLRYE